MSSNEPVIVQTKAGEPVTRVSDKGTGHHYTIPAAAFDPARHRPLKAPALDSYGEPAAPKFKATRDAEGTPAAGEVDAGEAGSSEAGNDTPQEDTEALEGVQGAGDEPGVYDEGDSSTEQEAQ